MNEKPIFQDIFGNDWNDLPPVMHKHYANRPYSHDITSVEGILDVMCAGPIKILAPLFWILCGIPPHNEKNVPVTVNFCSDENSQYFHFNRVFHFKKHKTYSFKSRMVQVKGDEVVEVMRSGFGWRMNYVWEDGYVKLNHKGYIFNFFGYFVPLPLTFLLGSGYAEESAVDHNTFDMIVTISHPWWGKIYEYKGQFKIKGQA